MIQHENVSGPRSVWHVHHVNAIAKRTVLRIENHSGVLDDGERLSSEQHLVGLEIDCLEKADVGWNNIAILEVDDVTGHDGTVGNLLDLAAANDSGGRAGHRAQGLHGLLTASGRAA